MSVHPSTCPGLGPQDHSLTMDVQSFPSGPTSFSSSGAALRCSQLAIYSQLVLRETWPLVITVFCFSVGKMNCTHPLVPEYGGFRCDPSPCQGFPHKTTIRLFCESGYKMRTSLSRCRNGKWHPPISACIPMKGESLKASSRSYSVLCFCLRSSKVIRVWC